MSFTGDLPNTLARGEWAAMPPPPNSWGGFLVFGVPWRRNVGGHAACVLFTLPIDVMCV